MFRWTILAFVCLLVFVSFFDVFAFGQKDLVPINSFFKSKLTRVSSVIDLDFSNSSTKVEFLLEWNEKVEPVLIDTFAHDIEVKYEGKIIPTSKTKGKSLAPVESTNKLPLVLNLSYLKRNMAETFSVNGKIKAIMPTGFHDVNFGSLSKLIAEGATEKTAFAADDSKCKINKVISGTSRISFGLRCEIAPNGPEFDTSQNWVVLNQLKFVNRKTLKVIPADGYILEKIENRIADLTYHFLLRDKSIGDFSDWDLGYKSVKGMKDQEIPFKFEAIPVP